MYVMHGIYKTKDRISEHELQNIAHSLKASICCFGDYVTQINQLINMIRIFIGAAVLTAALAQVSPPVWPEVFHQSFVESYPNSTHRVSGRFYFDSKRDMMRVDRTDGSLDFICGSVLPKVVTACTQLIRDKKRYLMYPQRRQCCVCCDQAHGCGTLKRDWLSTSKYQGEQKLQDESFYKWSIPDGDAIDLYYSQKNDQRTPRRITAGTVSTQDYLMNTYSTEVIPDSVFVLPDYCTTAPACSATSTCGKFQRKGMFSHEQ